MPSMKPLDVFFGEEWDRFTHGIQDLDPDRPRLTPAQEQYWRNHPNAPGTVNIPGWDDVIHLGPRPEVSPEQWKTYHQAIRAGQQPDLPADVVAELVRQDIARDARASSQLPGWAQAYGMVMTSIDNVQDFVSTVSTLGRVTIWGSQHLLDFLGPGSSEAFAQLLAREATREAAAVTAAELASLGLADRAFVSAAAQAAGRLAFRNALLGLGTRLALRAVPVMGWILLASDLLNLANLMLSAALPAYAALCDGPAAALAAGIPAVALKNVVCRRVWTNFHLNPFSRKARARAAVRALRGLPGIGALIEVAQVTDSLFGYGLSIGGLYGMVMEALFSATGAGNRSTSSLNVDSTMRSLGLPGLQRIDQMDTATRWAYHGASRAAQGIPIIQSQHDEFTDETHFQALTAAAAAVSVLHKFFDGWDSSALMAEVLGRSWSAPTYAHPNAIATDGYRSGVLTTTGRWPMPGAPREVRGEEYVKYYGENITRSLRSFLEPRRDTLRGLYYGAAVNQLTENLWDMIGGGEDPLAWELTPDSKLLTGMAVDGLVLQPRQPEAPVWAFWCELRDELEVNGGRLLEHDAIERTAKKHDVQLIRLLAPDAPLPPEWFAAASS